MQARLNKVKLLEAMAVFFERYYLIPYIVTENIGLLRCDVNYFCRSNRAVGGDNYAAGEVVRQCDLCQESSMVLKKNRVWMTLIQSLFKFGNSVLYYLGACFFITFLIFCALYFFLAFNYLKSSHLFPFSVFLMM